MSSGPESRQDIGVWGLGFRVLALGSKDLGLGFAGSRL